MQHTGLYKYLLISDPPLARSTCPYNNFAPFFKALRRLTLSKLDSTLTSVM